MFVLSAAAFMSNLIFHLWHLVDAANLAWDSFVVPESASILEHVQSDGLAQGNSAHG